MATLWCSGAFSLDVLLHPSVSARPVIATNSMINRRRIKFSGPRQQSAAVLNTAFIQSLAVDRIKPVYFFGRLLRR